jgi:hypothetical protein
MSSTIFSFSGGPQGFAVPDGVEKIEVSITGAQGGGPLGGLGDTVTASIDVTPGEVLTVYVGGRPSDASSGYGGAPGGAGGSAPGGDPLGGGPGFGGGGSSEIWSSGDRLVIAGAGGGQGGALGDNAGGEAGKDGQAFLADGLEVGKAGMSGAGGAGGTKAPGAGMDGSNGGNGSDSAGGDGGVTTSTSPIAGGGGGGGGGYGGGGGGAGSATLPTGFIPAGAGGGGGRSGTATPERTTISDVDHGSGTGDGTVTLSYFEALAPEIFYPMNGSTEDLGAGFDMEWSYWPSSPDCSQTAFAIRVKQTGASSYLYWNVAGGILQSTIVWNPGSSTLCSIPAGVISDGPSYNIAVALQDQGGQGEFCTDIAVTASTGPSAAIITPAGILDTINVPEVAWTYSDPIGSPQINYRVLVFTADAVEDTGFDPDTSSSVFDSNWVATTRKYRDLNAPLPTGRYVAYLMVSNSETQTSGWATSAFTIRAEKPGQPSIEVAAGREPLSGTPHVIITVNGHDNLLTADQAELIDGTTAGWSHDSDCTIATSPIWALGGQFSLLLTPTSTAVVTAATVES